MTPPSPLYVVWVCGLALVFLGISLSRAIKYVEEHPESETPRGNR